ncbi:hypothetical protein ISI01_31400, partial [Burkholderia pseudomallei]|nr:hypothetical protein [Burkholderia pseudomallei]
MLEKLKGSIWDSALVIGVFTVVVYLFSYGYQYAYKKYFSIPEIFISMELKDFAFSNRTITAIILLGVCISMVVTIGYIPQFANLYYSVIGTVITVLIFSFIVAAFSYAILDKTFPFFTILFVFIGINLLSSFFVVCHRLGLENYIAISGVAVTLL